MRKRVIKFRLPEEYYRGLKELVERGKYKSVNEAVNKAVEELLKSLSELEA